ncbi:MAG TPA: biotin/lipoyl-containing protein, partial [Xanthomonadales bacterium]|nr:biotin/lipoyl-containing protein [Xanthomonadales bacterium]
MAERIEIKVPDIGDFADVPVIEVLVAPGDQVEAEHSLVTLESDKATMEVPSPAAGLLAELKVALGDTVSEGDVVAVLEAEEQAGTEEQPSEPEPEEPPAEEAPGEDPQAEAASADEPEAGEDKQDKPQKPAAELAAGPRRSPPVATGAATTLPDRVPYASPAVRRFARELGVDLSRVTGSGRKQRILREDVTA